MLIELLRFPQWKLDIITVCDKLTKLPLFHLVFFALMEGVTSHPSPPSPCICPWNMCLVRVICTAVSLLPGSTANYEACSCNTW